MNSTIPSEILLVEDDADTRAALCDVLELDDYHVATAGTLAEALADREWNRVLAVILDRRLPDGTAEDILPELSKVAPEAAVIIMTGYADVESAIAALRHGATDYFTKPVQPDRLRNSLSMIAARRRAEQMFETVINAAPIAMLLVDDDSRIVFANNETQTTFGYLPEEICGQSIELLIPASLRDAHRDQFAKYVADPQVQIMARGRQLTAQRKDGTVFPAEVSLTPVEQPGQPFVLAVVEDITERRKAEALREVEIQLSVARRVQQNLFPAHPPEIEGYDIGGAAYPADATGGDYFDFISLPDDRQALVIGDVSGHGIGPAMIMALTRSYLRATALTNRRPGEILTQVNQLLSDDITSGSFMTLFWAELTSDTGELHYAAAGHPGYIIHTDGPFTELKPTGVVLGPLPESQVETAPAITLQPGEVFVLMTDGVWEASSPDNAFFGVTGAMEFIHKHREQPAQMIVESLCREVLEHASPHAQADDITVLILKVAETHI